MSGADGMASGKLTKTPKPRGDEVEGTRVSSIRDGASSWYRCEGDSTRVCGDTLFRRARNFFRSWPAAQRNAEIAIAQSDCREL